MKHKLRIFRGLHFSSFIAHVSWLATRLNPSLRSANGANTAEL
jgi:hypothetical protein